MLFEHKIKHFKYVFSTYLHRYFDSFYCMHFRALIMFFTQRTAMIRYNKYLTAEFTYHYIFS